MRTGCLFFISLFAVLVVSSREVGEALGDWIDRVVPGDLGVLTQLQIAAVVITASVFANAVHEIGHVSLGRWRGLRLLCLGSGPFLVDRKGGSLRLRRNPLMGLFGGVIMAAGEVREPTATDLRWFLRGGPLASACLGFLAIVVAAATQPAGPSESNVMWTGWVYLGAYSILTVALALGLPGTRRTPGFDGARLRSIAGSEGALRAELDYLKICSGVVDRLRYRDFPAEWIRDPAYDCPPAHRTMCSFYRARAALDRGDLQANLVLSEEAVDDFESMGVSEKALVGPARALALAWCAGDADGARAWLQKSPAVFGPYYHHLAEAAALCVDREADQATKTLAMASLALDESFHPDSPSEVALVETLEEEARGAKSLPDPKPFDPGVAEISHRPFALALFPSPGQPVKVTSDSTSRRVCSRHSWSPGP